MILDDYLDESNKDNYFFDLLLTPADVPILRKASKYVDYVQFQANAIVGFTEDGMYITSIPHVWLFCHSTTPKKANLTVRTKIVKGLINALISKSAQI